MLQLCCFVSQTLPFMFFLTASDGHAGLVQRQTVTDMKQRDMMFQKGKQNVIEELDYPTPNHALDMMSCLYEDSQ